MSAALSTLPAPSPWDDLDNALADECHRELDAIGSDFDTMVSQFSDGVIVKRRDGMWHATWSGSREAVTAIERDPVDALAELHAKLVARVKEGW